MTYLHRLILVILFILPAGCQSIDIRGQHINDDVVREINNEHPNKEQLIAKIGTPTYIPDYSNNTWYYIQRSLAQRAGFEPKVVDQRIVRVIFGGDKVLNATLLDNSYNEEISSQADYTKTYGTERNGIQKFVKNIGRFNKTTDGKKKKKKK